MIESRWGARSISSSLLLKPENLFLSRTLHYSMSPVTLFRPSAIVETYMTKRRDQLQNRLEAFFYTLLSIPNSEVNDSVSLGTMYLKRSSKLLCLCPFSEFIQAVNFSKGKNIP